MVTEDIQPFFYLKSSGWLVFFQLNPSGNKLPRDTTESLLRMQPHCLCIQGTAESRKVQVNREEWKEKFPKLHCWIYFPLLKLQILSNFFKIFGKLCAISFWKWHSMDRTWLCTFAQIHASKCEETNLLQNDFIYIYSKKREFSGILFISYEWLKKFYFTHSMNYFDTTVLFHGRWSTGLSCSHFLPKSSSPPCRVSHYGPLTIFCYYNSL